MVYTNLSTMKVIRKLIIYEIANDIALVCDKIPSIKLIIHKIFLIIQKWSIKNNE